MKRLFAGLAVVASLVLVSAPPASAQTSIDLSRYLGPLGGGGPVSAIGGGGAFQSCVANNNAVLLHSPFGTEEFELPSLAACVSSLQAGRVSWLAFYQNCQQLEPMFAADNASGRAYPYSFYGNPNYTANNRLDCVYFLWSFHTGALPPGPGGS
jgi:hypothetical protein